MKRLNVINAHGSCPQLFRDALLAAHVRRPPHSDRLRPCRASLPSHQRLSAHVGAWHHVAVESLSTRLLSSLLAITSPQQATDVPRGSWRRRWYNVADWPGCRPVALCTSWSNRVQSPTDTCRVLGPEMGELTLSMSMLLLWKGSGAHVL